MKIVAVTSCPSGIAHTYMAEAALKKAAKKMGLSIKIETQGSLGIQNELKKDEIREADLVILAVEVALTRGERFKDKPIMKATIGEIIKNAQWVIQRAIDTLGAQD